MGSKRRFVVLGIIGLAAVVAVTMMQGFEYLWVQFNLSDPALLGVSQLRLTNVLGALVGAGGATFCFAHGRTFTLATEVVEELTRVTWPAKQETGSATVVVIVTVIICSLYLGAFDAVWLALTNWVLGVQAS